MPKKKPLKPVEEFEKELFKDDKSLSQDKSNANESSIKKETKKYRAAVISMGSTSSEWIIERMRDKFRVVDSFSLADIQINLGAKEPEIFHNGVPLPKYDCVYA